MKAKITAFLSLMSLSFSLFGETPLHFSFIEGEKIKIELSSLEFNKIKVMGEDIIEVSFPDGAFAIEAPLNEEQDDGSIYLKTQYDQPLTAFFTTNKGHHFSLLIGSKGNLSKTIELSNKKEERLHFAKLNSNNDSIAKDIM